MFYFLLLLKAIVNIRFSSKSQGKKIRIENLRGGDHLKKKESGPGLSISPSQF